MKKCLITGGTGLIGRELVSILRNSWDIYLLGGSHFDETFDDLTVIKQNLAEGLNERALPKQIDAVIHLAQSAHFREFPDRSTEVFQVNTLSTLHLLEYARKAGASTFILASSGGVYGYGDEGFLEDRPVVVNRDLGFYLSTKLCSEIISENYTNFFNVIMMRFFFVYGVNQRPEMLIQRLIHRVDQGIPIQLHGSEGISINPIYVSDAALAVSKALSLNKSHKINIGGGQKLNLKEIGTIIGKVIGKDPIFEHDWEATPKHLLGDIKKMISVLGPPEIPFEKGIRKVTGL